MSEDTDSNQLLNAVLPFCSADAREARHTFLPFGASVSANGEVTLCQGIPDTENEEAILEASLKGAALANMRWRASRPMNDQVNWTPWLAPSQESGKVRRTR
jgi:hypothetical protein